MTFGNAYKSQDKYQTALNSWAYDEVVSGDQQSDPSVDSWDRRAVGVMREKVPADRVCVAGSIMLPAGQ